MEPQLKTHFGALNENGLGKTLCRMRIFTGGKFHFTEQIADVTCLNCQRALVKNEYEDPQLLIDMARLIRQFGINKDFYIANLIARACDRIKSLEVMAAAKKRIHIEKPQLAFNLEVCDGQAQ